jgi:phosphoenolpyruvate carboxylase
VVRGNPDFIAYFHQATPAGELGELPLGSRPASRNPQGGIESLRAIPWQFAWMQNRLLLPAWLGAGTALRAAIAQGAQPALEALCRDWPFFSTRIALLEMVYAKSDAYVAAYYDRQLVEPRLWPLGEALRGELSQDIRAVLDITNDEDLMRDLPWARRAVELRSIYIDPLHILQAELLARKRRQDCGAVNSALMITITGIAAGLRNTG